MIHKEGKVFKCIQYFKKGHKRNGYWKIEVIENK